jgi:chromosomal replication initiation ATPase DnaA
MTTTLQNTAIELVISAGIATGVPHSRIYSNSRVRLVVRTRWAIWHTLRTRHDWTFREIADEFGCEHSNIIHGVNRAASLILTNTWFAALSKTLSH